MGKILCFNEFLESISVDQNGFVGLSIDKEPSRSADSISTFQPNRLRSTADKSKTLGNRVYYAYSYESSSIVTDLLKSIKGSGSSKLDLARLDLFVEKTAKYMAEHLKDQSFDILAAPKSSAPLVKLFAYKLGKHLGIEVVYDSFAKFKLDIPAGKEESIQYVIDKFIDLDQFGKTFRVVDEKERKEALRKLARGIISSINKSGKIELKALYKPTAKYAANFLKPEVHTELKFLGKKVLVVDDSLSSGGTMMEIFRQLNKLGAHSMSGAVMFKQESRK